MIKCALAVFIGVIQYFLLKYGIVSEWIFDDPERGVAAAFIVIAAVGWIVMNGLFHRLLVGSVEPDCMADMVADGTLSFSNPRQHFCTDDLRRLDVLFIHAGRHYLFKLVEEERLGAEMEIR